MFLPSPSIARYHLQLRRGEKTRRRGRKGSHRRRTKGPRTGRQRGNDAKVFGCVMVTLLGDSGDIMANVFHVTSDYEGKEGWDEAKLYDGKRRDYFSRRAARWAVRQLQKRAQSLWPHEPIAYTLV